MTGSNKLHPLKLPEQINKCAEAALTQLQRALDVMVRFHLNGFHIIEIAVIFDELQIGRDLQPPLDHGFVHFQMVLKAEHLFTETKSL